MKLPALRRLPVAAGLLGVLLGALAWRLLLRAGLDLSDWPGAASGQRITEAARGNFSQTFDGWLTGLTLVPFGGDPGQVVQALALQATLGGLASVLGAGLAAGVLAGRRSAWLTAGLVAVWAPAVWVSLLYGADAAGLGLAWLGLGLCWWGAARAELIALPLCWLGAALVALGAAVRPTCLPVLAWVLLAPLLAPGLARGVLLAAGLGATLAWSWIRLGLAAEVGTQGGALPLSPEVWSRGLALLQEQAFGGLAFGGYFELALLAVLGLLLPVARPGLRLLAVGASILALPLLVGVDFSTARPRVLLPSALGLVLGAGVLVGRGADLLAASARLPDLRWLPGALLLTLLALDGLAFLGAWSAAREAFTGTAASRLPTAPAPFVRRHRHLSEASLNGVTARGVVAAQGLAEEAPPVGVGLAPLRDRREAHFSAALQVAGKGWRVLEPQRCCGRDEVAEACAARLVTEVDAAGGWLLLPGELQEDLVDLGQIAWVAALSQAAEAAGGTEALAPGWVLRRGTGSGDELPCGPAQRRRSRSP